MLRSNASFRVIHREIVMFAKQNRPRMVQPRRIDPDARLDPGQRFDSLDAGRTERFVSIQPQPS